jgi:hypothetical protein
LASPVAKGAQTGRRTARAAQLSQTARGGVHVGRGAGTAALSGRWAVGSGPRHRAGPAWGSRGAGVGGVASEARAARTVAVARRSWGRQPRCREGRPRRLGPPEEGAAGCPDVWLVGSRGGAASSSRSGGDLGAAEGVVDAAARPRRRGEALHVDAVSCRGTRTATPALSHRISPPPSEKDEAERE